MDHFPLPDISAQKGQGKVNCSTFGPSFRHGPRARFELVPASGSFGWDTWWSTGSTTQPLRQALEINSSLHFNGHCKGIPWNIPTKYGQKYGQKYGTLTYLHFRILDFPLIIESDCTNSLIVPTGDYLYAAVLVEMIQLFLQEYRLIHLASCAQCVLIKQWMYDHSPMGKIPTDGGYHHGYTHL